MFERGPGLPASSQPLATSIGSLHAGVLALALTLAAATAARADPTLYTIDAPTAFSGLGIMGTIHPVSPQEVQGFGFSGSGELGFATVGDHVCNDGVGFFGACFDTMHDLFIYRVSLGPESMPLGDVTPSFAPANASDQWAGYIFDDDAGTHEPDGEIFSNFSRGVVFQNFANAQDPAAYLQPGETSAVLLTGFTPGSVATGLAGGPFSVWIRQGPAFGFDNFSVAVTVVPEPDAGAGVLTAALVMAGLARRNRCAHRGTSSSC